MIYCIFSSRKFIISNISPTMSNRKHDLVQYKCIVSWAVLFQLQLYKIAIVAGVIVTTSTILVCFCNLDTLSISPTESFATHDTRPQFVNLIINFFVSEILSVACIFLYSEEVNMLIVRYLEPVIGRAFFGWGGLNVFVACVATPSRMFSSPRQSMLSYVAPTMLYQKYVFSEYNL